MIVLGLLLLVLAVIFGADLILQNHFAIPGVSTFGFQLGLGNSAELFIVGVITGAAILLGIALMAAGAGRKGKKALDRRHHQDEQNRLEAENDRLRSNLNQRPVVEETTVTRPVVTRETAARPERGRQDGDEPDGGRSEGGRPGATRV